MSEQNGTKKYWLGLDIGTDSVGYAVTDMEYNPIRKKGEPLMGVTTFEEAAAAADRRGYRTARRRIDRRQQRVQLVRELFAPAIAETDPLFFKRLNENALFRDDAGEAFTLFNDSDYSDKDYHRQYPTIHHLLTELMHSTEAHDVRLVYLACSWLAAHRGHFLFDVAPKNVAELLDFGLVYQSFCDWFREADCRLPWSETVEADTIRDILLLRKGVSAKKELFRKNIYGGRAPSKKPTIDFPFSEDAIVRLLCGSSLKPEEIFQTGEYAELKKSVSLTMGDEEFAAILSQMGENGELLRRLQALQDCALLLMAKNGMDTISEAKVAVYAQHRDDLKKLKCFIRKYAPEKYGAIFRAAGKDNYMAYSGNFKNAPSGAAQKRVKKEDFSAFLKAQVKDIRPQPEDQAFFDDMMTRLELRSFLPKQRDGDNRVIPQQLYRYELERVLEKASGYLPWMNETDVDGLTPAQKLLSIFDYKIPYFVGPLTGTKPGGHGWVIRKGTGKIYPWNFASMVDFDRSEEAFIQRMTNTCTYMAGAEVLPEKSLLYGRFMVLNELNNLKIDGNPIPVGVKQDLYRFVMERDGNTTLKQLTGQLLSAGQISRDSILSGIDGKLNAVPYAHRKFRNLMLSGKLSEDETEAIIRRAAYCEDRSRFTRWLEAHYPQLTKEDRRYIAGLDLKGFGRLSKEFLTELFGGKAATRDSETGEVFTVMELLWNTNENLMQLLSANYTFRENLESVNRDYYREHPQSLSGRLDEMYISNGVKRPIFRTLDICADVVKIMGGQPECIFVEMARGASEEQKGKRTQPRKQQLLALLEKVKTEDARRLEQELADMGELADNRLQSDKLFLYYLQMGKCAYSGKPIELSRLASGDYNIDHIYPRSFVKDDSLLNNKVLVDSKINGDKTDIYPIAPEIQNKMRSVWETWKEAGSITEEKLRRLTRCTPFTEDEKWSFINRQLVETRQSTKAIAALLQERYPSSRIVYVKAGLVSEYRQAFGLLKSRQVNDLHHAKDAYLNIVVGNVYDCRFSRKWFRPTESYNVQAEKLFKKPVMLGGETIWRGQADIEKVAAVMGKDHIRVTRFAFCRKGGLFDQQPVTAAPGLIPLKKGLPTEKYGGYNKPTASFFWLVRYTAGKKRDIMFMPVELLAAERCRTNADAAIAYAKEKISSIIGKPVSEAEILLSRRPIKVNTVIEVDGLRLLLCNKTGGGTRIGVSLLTPLKLGRDMERYVKTLESVRKKITENPGLVPDTTHDHVSPEENARLYQTLKEKWNTEIYRHCPNNMSAAMEKGEPAFAALEINDQIGILLGILFLFSSSFGSADLKRIGGSGQSGVKALSAHLSNWAKNYRCVRIIDQSASGIFEKQSVNLLDLL